MPLDRENSVCPSAASNLGPRRGPLRVRDPIAALPTSIRGWARRVAGCRLPVLVLGETGSGKERAARALHQAGPRREGAFVAVNAAAIPDTLLEAELFGAVRGAYTGADRDRRGLFRRADGGTLFLDEVGDMTAALQAKLLRVLQEGRFLPVGADDETEVDVRVIAATHRDLRRACDAGRFRQDLYYRLAVLQLRLPPLRERLDELEGLAGELTPALCRDTGCPPPSLGAGAWAALRAHRWPGNVRELQAVLARAMLRVGGRTIGAADLDLDRLDSTPGTPEPLERSMIRHALEETGGRLADAARLIGWSRQKLYRRLRALSLVPPGSTSSDSSTFQ